MSWHQVYYEIHQNLTLVRAALRNAEIVTSHFLSPSPFRGNVSEKFKLPDGSIWQVKCYISADIIIGDNRSTTRTSITTGESLNVQFISGLKTVSKKIVASIW